MKSFVILDWNVTWTFLVSLPDILFTKPLERTGGLEIRADVMESMYVASFHMSPSA